MEDEGGKIETLSAADKAEIWQIAMALLARGDDDGPFVLRVALGRAVRDWLEMNMLLEDGIEVLEDERSLIELDDGSWALRTPAPRKRATRRRQTPRD